MFNISTSLILLYLFIIYLPLSPSLSLSLLLSFSQRFYQGFFASPLHLPTVSTLGFYECCLSREMIEIDHMKIRKHVCSVYSWNPYVCRIYQNAAISGVRLQQLRKHEFCCPIANLIFIFPRVRKIILICIRGEKNGEFSLIHIF